MKKVLSVLAVLIIVSSAVFAGNFSARAHVAPVPFFLTVPMIGDDFFNINGDIELDYYVTDNFRVGIEAEGNYSFTKEAEGITEFADALLLPFFAFAKAGYSFPVSEKFAIAVDAGIGGCSFDGAPVLAATAQLTGAYKFNSNVALEFGAKADGLYKDKQVRIIPVWYPIIGVEYKF